jgi:hypothetical protein
VTTGTGVGTAETERKERTVAWTATIVACVYCGWLGLTVWRDSVEFGPTFGRLGVELPAVTRLLVNHGAAIGAVWAMVFIALLLVKEIFVRDKRLSAMLTCLVAIVAQFAAHWVTRLYFQPLFDILRKLG